MLLRAQGDVQGRIRLGGSAGQWEQEGGSRAGWRGCGCSPGVPRQPQVLPGSPGAARRGLLWILDEEVLIPGSGDGTAFERLCSYFATKGPDQEGELGSASGITIRLWEFGRFG